MKKVGIFLVFLILVSCNTATEKWLNSLANFKEFRSTALSLEIMKINSATTDTATLNYKIRIFPSKQWVESHTQEQKNGLYYGMDSCFALRAGKSSIKALFIQPVNNGIANCFEYLVSFDIREAIKVKNIQLVYQDKFIDNKQYKLELNR